MAEKAYIAHNGDDATFVALAATTLTVGGIAVAPTDAIGVISADGAVTITAANKLYVITKASAAAITIANPTATTHDGVTLTFVSTTAAAHTLSNAAGAGFNDGGAGGDVGTFGGAKGDNITIVAYGGKWYVLNSVNVTLG